MKEFLYKIQMIVTNSENIEFAVYMLAGGLILIGVYLFCGSEMKELFDTIFSKHVHKRNKIKSRAKLIYEKINKYLEKLIEANNLPDWIDTKRFKLICIGIFLVCFYFGQNVLLPTVALIDAFVIAILPVVFLRVNLERKRTRLSYDAEVLLNEFITKYRLRQFNVEEALEDMLDIKRLKQSKKTIARMLLKLRSARYDTDMREATDLFAFTVGTNWARMFAINIYHAKAYGVNITSSLENMIELSREGKDLLEHKKRSIAEPLFMLFVIPLLYIYLFYTSVGTGDISLNQYIQNQFFTEQGVSCLSLIIIGTAISVIYTILIYSKKFDF